MEELDARVGLAEQREHHVEAAGVQRVDVEAAADLLGPYTWRKDVFGGGHGRAWQRKYRHELEHALLADVLLDHALRLGLPALVALRGRGHVHVARRDVPDPQRVVDADVEDAGRDLRGLHCAAAAARK